MKACCVGILLILAPVTFSQTVVFSEDVGTPAATTIVSNYTGWQNGAPILFASTSSPESDVRNTTASTAYSGASGGGNVFFTNVIGRNLVISGINSSGFSNLRLSFGHYKSATAGNNELLVEVSGDGIQYVPLEYTRATGTGTANWIYITCSGNIPATPNLHIRFTQTSASVQFRIDDIRLAADAVLPVRFGYLRLSGSGSNLRLEWTNLTESDISHYTIQAGTPGLGFQSVDTVHPRLNNGEAAEYSRRMQSISPQDLLFRVEATEYNGAKYYSAVVSREPEHPGLRIFPNPNTTRQIAVQANLPRGHYLIRVLDACGATVYRQAVVHGGGAFSTTLYVSRLSAGTYTLLVGERSIRFLVL